MFIDNKYTRYYYALVEYRKATPASDQYTEKHHIIPKSLGGSNDADNIVVLTGREHYVAHRLLCKMTEGVSNQKMWLALHRMIHGKLSPAVNSREYSYFREQWSRLASEHHPSKQGDGWGLKISKLIADSWKDANERRIKTGEVLSRSHRERQQNDPEYFTKQRKSAIMGANAAKEKCSLKIEYKGVVYVGWRELYESTKITKHLYKKYYLNGVDPEPRIGANGPPANIP